jgi:hypothetical protein
VEGLAMVAVLVAAGCAPAAPPAQDVAADRAKLEADVSGNMGWITGD